MTSVVGALFTMIIAVTLSAFLQHVLDEKRMDRDDVFLFGLFLGALMVILKLQW